MAWDVDIRGIMPSFLLYLLYFIIFPFSYSSMRT